MNTILPFSLLSECDIIIHIMECKKECWIGRKKQKIFNIIPILNFSSCFNVMQIWAQKSFSLSCASSGKKLCRLKRIFTKFHLRKFFIIHTFTQNWIKLKSALYSKEGSEENEHRDEWREEKKKFFNIQSFVMENVSWEGKCLMWIAQSKKTFTLKTFMTNDLKLKCLNYKSECKVMSICGCQGYFLCIISLLKSVSKEFFRVNH